ncbi:MAG: transcription antitermination factor NusB [Desulfoprunum sp.]|nr:transcription antitermination factor NusB [Desulfoprunum sp.]
MGIRRQSREAAMQFLFQDDFYLEKERALDDLQESFEFFCSLFQISRKGRSYAIELLEKTIKNRGQIDGLIAAAAVNWRLQRIAAADRNVLRLAVCEMLFSDDVPDEVAINEAVEIARRFGGDDSPSFVNGVLDAVRKILRG